MIVKGQLDKKTNHTTATLRCNLGTFIVAQAAHFPDGQTTGFFELKTLTPSTVQRNASMLLVIEAALGEVILQTGDSTSNNAQLSLDAESATGDTTVDNVATDGTSIETECSGVGLPTPLPNTISIDTTLDRSLISKQIALLKKMGYTFNAQTQVWTKEVA